MGSADTEEMRLLLILLLAAAALLVLWGVGMLVSAWKEPGAAPTLGWGLLGTGVVLAGATWLMNLWGVLEAM